MNSFVLFLLFLILVLVAVICNSKRNNIKGGTEKTIILTAHGGIIPSRIAEMWHMDPRVNFNIPGGITLITLTNVGTGCAPSIWQNLIYNPTRFSQFVEALRHLGEEPTKAMIKALLSRFDLLLDDDTLHPVMYRPGSESLDYIIDFDVVFPVGEPPRQFKYGGIIDLKNGREILQEQGGRELTEDLQTNKEKRLETILKFHNGEYIPKQEIINRASSGREYKLSEVLDALVQKGFVGNVVLYMCLSNAAKNIEFPDLIPEGVYELDNVGRTHSYDEEEKPERVILRQTVLRVIPGHYNTKIVNEPFKPRDRMERLQILNEHRIRPLPPPGSFTDSEGKTRNVSFLQENKFFKENVLKSNLPDDLKSKLLNKLEWLSERELEELYYIFGFEVGKEISERGGIHLYPPQKEKIEKMLYHNPPPSELRKLQQYIPPLRKLREMSLPELWRLCRDLGITEVEVDKMKEKEDYIEWLESKRILRRIYPEQRFDLI